MNVLITGGAGYIGTALVERLSTNGNVEEIIIYDNLSRKNHNLFLFSRLKDARTAISFIYGDLLDSRKLKKVVQKSDVIYHLAARVTTPFASEDPHLFEQVNHWGTAELSYAIEQSNTARRIVYLSSASVYGSSDKPLDKHMTPNPVTHYGISKLKGEKQLLRLNDREVYIIRCGNVFGFSPAIRFDSVINKFMFDAHFNKRITIHGSGKQSRAFIHIDNIARLLSALLEDNALQPGIYDAVEVNYTILEISSVLKEIYPSLEMIFIQQSLEMRNLRVNPDGELLEKNYIKPEQLTRALEKFKGMFAF